MHLIKKLLDYLYQLINVFFRHSFQVTGVKRSWKQLWTGTRGSWEFLGSGHESRISKIVRWFSTMSRTEPVSWKTTQSFGRNYAANSRKGEKIKMQRISWAAASLTFRELAPVRKESAIRQEWSYCERRAGIVPVNLPVPFNMWSKKNMSAGSILMSIFAPERKPIYFSQHQRRKKSLNYMQLQLWQCRFETDQINLIRKIEMVFFFIHWWISK